MPRPALEVADIFRDRGAAWRNANRGHVSLGQLKVMSAIEDCRTAVLGGHVARCENALCGFTSIAYNSCRNRHCPKCQGAQAREWMADREADLLPVPYFHVVFTLHAEIADIACTNKAVIYDRLFKASSETMLTIAVRRAIGAHLPVRLVNALAERIGIEDELGNIRDQALHAAAATLRAWSFRPNGTEGFAKAEVTAGGIATDGLSSRTMQARSVQGLYVIGEAVDVTGWLGGYNFQWAWASGWAAGQAIAAAG